MTALTAQQAFRLALEHFNAGRLSETEAVCRQILSQNPDDADTLHLLGGVAHRVGKFEAAVELTARAAQIYPYSADLWASVGSAYLAMNKLDDAIGHADRALRIQPSHLQALNIRGAAMFHAGRWADALLAWQKILLQTPNDAMLHSNIAVTLERLGRLDEAVAAARRAIELNPKSAQAHDNLGAALTKAGRTAEGLKFHLQAIELNPDHANAHNNVAYCLYELGRLDQAEAAARTAVALAPDDPAPLRTLGATLVDVGMIDEAGAAFDCAIALMRRKDQGDCLNRDLLARTQLTAATMLPQVYESLDDIEPARTRLIANLQKLHDEKFTLTLDDEAIAPLFPLAYQGRNDVDIQRSLALLVRAPQPQLPAKSGGKIRVTFISRFLKNHTIGRLNAGVIEHVNRDEFEVNVVSIGQYDDALASSIKQRAARYDTIPPSLRVSREVIAQQRPDIIYFTDIGMEPMSYSLAFSRLAPVQCVTWGHPLTTGIDTVDYFISSQLLEIPDAQAHYTERLIRLPSLAVHYHAPVLPDERKNRGDFGLDENANLYGCLQAVWKLHPEFDELIAHILRRDPNGRLLLLESNTHRWQQKLKQRFSWTLGDTAQRVQFIPQQKLGDFLMLTSLCDVMLDPIHFGGGNTSYEAFAFGVPVLTLPSQFLRGRITAAQYKMMGLDDCVATSRDDYIDRAVAIGSDRQRRRAVSEKILNANSVLYENLQGVRQLEEFFKQAVAERARSSASAHSSSVP